jgi:hypothetical protein
VARPAVEPGSAVATTTRLIALLRITACKGEEPGETDQQRKSELGAPKPMSPPSTPTRADDEARLQRPSEHVLGSGAAALTLAAAASATKRILYVRLGRGSSPTGEPY